jgi:hypothetical protein
MPLFRYIGVQKNPGYTLAALANAGFNPDEPRLPAGQPCGGQWTSGDEKTAATDDDDDNSPKTIGRAAKETAGAFLSALGGLLRGIP